MIPKGTLLIIGGAEDKGDDNELKMARKNREFKHFAILKLLLKGEKKVEVITTGSKRQEKVKKNIRRPSLFSTYMNDVIHSQI